MAHFAKVLDKKVIKVIVAEKEFFNTFVDDSAGEWIQTSYNTFGNKHSLGGIPLRGNYAGIGYTYDKENDVFYSAKPYSSWILNEDTWLWEAPVAMPIDDNKYSWNEQTLSWDIVEV